MPRLLLRFDHLQGNGALTLLTAAMVLICACSRAPSLQSDLPQHDSLTLHINSPAEFSHLDIFIFTDTLTRALEMHLRAGASTFVSIPAGTGPKRVVAVGNVQGIFSGHLPEQYSVMEHIIMFYADENPDAPLLTGECRVPESTELLLSPILCPVTINTIRFDSDAPLCYPVLQLEHVNASAQLLQTDGFHPALVLDSAETLKYPLMMMRELPFDIGSQAQKAGITLYCYPNEDEAVPGGRSTELLVTGHFRQELKQFRIPLGPVKRGAGLNLDIELKL